MSGPTLSANLPPQGTLLPPPSPGEMPGAGALSTTLRTHSGGSNRPRGARRVRPDESRRPRFNVVPRDGVRLVRRDYHLLKRLLDVGLCLLLLPCALLLMAACAVLVWLDDPGPVLFRQLRTGRGGRRFKMYKFRTMLKDAEQLKQKYAHLNELTPPDFKITDDPRVTRVGRWLRRTSLDELPQIINVLRGDMSLVGPRPTSFDASTYSLWQMERLEVCPGITGLWQVSGRSEIDFDERLLLDIDYIERRSLRLDAEILLRTVFVLFSRRGAY